MGEGGGRRCTEVASAEPGRPRPTAFHPVLDKNENAASLQTTRAADSFTI